VSQPKVVQGAPGGYLVDLGDGSEPRLWPEHVAVEAGLVPPTQGLYQSSAQSPGVDPYAAPQAPVDVAQQMVQPAAPAPTPAPGVAPAAAPTGPAPGTSQRAGYSAGESHTDFVRRTDVNAPPDPLDLSEAHAALDEQRGVMDRGYDAQQVALNDRAAAETRADEIRHGRFDPQTGKLLEAGGDQMASDERMNAASNREAFDRVTQEYVDSETARINERVARVPQEDPSRIWHENNAFQNAAGILSAVLGGMLAVSTGSGRNMGLEAVEHAIDRDIQAQRTNIENEWKKVASDKEGLAQYRQWKGQERSHMLEESVVRLETLAIDTEAKASTFSSKARQAEYMGQAANLRVLQADKNAELIKSKAEYAMAESAAAHKNWYDMEKLSLDKKIGRSQIAENYAQAGAANRANQPKPTEAQSPIPVFTMPNGERLYLDPKMTQGRTNEQVGKLANDLGQDVVRHASVTDALQKYRQLVKDVGSKYAGPGSNNRVWGDADIKTVKDAQQRLSSVIAKSMSGAQYAEAFREAVHQFVGAPRSWTGIDPEKSQTQYIEDSLSEMDRDLGGRGVIKGKIIEAGRGQPGDPAAIEGPRQDGSGAVLPKGTRGERMVPFSAKDNFYYGDTTDHSSKPLVEGVKELGRVVLTGDDPHATLQALNQLSNAADAPLAVAGAAVNDIFMGSELGTKGGKQTVRYAGEGKDQAGTKPRSVDEGVRTMRNAAMRAAAKADEQGDSATASQIMDAAAALEQRMRGQYSGEPSNAGPGSVPVTSAGDGFSTGGFAPDGWSDAIAGRR
jgi:hypothetical protein